MEISHVSGSSPIKPVQPKAVSQVKAPEDTLCISKEAEKMERWVKMLHEMPDIRPDKIASAIQSQAQCNLAKACAVVAQEIQNENSLR